MAMWGGGAGMGGPLGGGGRPGAPVAGLPFGGIPSEMIPGVERLMADEPDHPAPDAHFSQKVSEDDTRRLSLWRLLAAYPRLTAIAVVLVIVLAVFTQLGPKLTEIAINDGMSPGHEHFGVVALMAGLYLVAVGISALSQRWQAEDTGRLAAGVMHDLRIRVFTHLQRLSLDFYTEEKAGVVMSRMTSDIENLQQLVQDGLSQLALQALTMVVIAVILFLTNVELAFITIVMVVPILVVMTLWFRNASERGYSRVRDGIALVLADLSESLHGVRIVTSHNRQRHNVIHHRNVVGNYRDANMYTARVNAVYGPGSQLIGVLGQAALLAIGGTMVVNHQLSIGALIAFFLYLGRFFQPIQLLVQQFNSYQQGTSSILKLRTLLETEPTVVEADDATDLGPVEGEIVFDDVSFGYDPSVPVLFDVNLRIAPGETVAFVGPTGAGKSTIAKLVTRFYDPTGGRVLLDGHDLRDVTMASLRSQLGVVPQEPFLFAGTVRDNIALRPSRCDRRRGGRSRREGRPHRRRGPALPRHRHPRARARAVAVVGRAPAHRPGAGLPGPPPRARPRRGHLQPRPAVRDPDRGRPRRPARGPHRRAHRPPAVDGHARRPDRRGRRGAGRRIGTPRRPGRRRRPVRGDVRHLGQPRFRSSRGRRIGRRRGQRPALTARRGRAPGFVDGGQRAGARRGRRPVARWPGGPVARWPGGGHGAVQWPRRTADAHIVHTSRRRRMNWRKYAAPTS